jgi:hypothetical protein
LLQSERVLQSERGNFNFAQLRDRSIEVSHCNCRTATQGYVAFDLLFPNSKDLLLPDRTM